MTDDNVAIFAGMYLSKYKWMTAIDLQHYIKDDPNVQKVLPIEQIETVLDNMQYAKLLDICGQVEGNNAYCRYGTSKCT